MRRRINCKCGYQVTTNTIQNHVKSQYCTASSSEKTEILSIVDLYRKNNSMYFKQLGVEACRDVNWFSSVIEGKTDLSQWTHIKPRGRYENRPSAIENLKIQRLGTQNPVCKKQPSYNLADIRGFQSDFRDDFLIGKISFEEVMGSVNARYPKFTYNLDMDRSAFGTARGRNYRNYAMQHIMQIDIDEVIEARKKFRGKKISMAQLQSPVFQQFATKQGAALQSRSRVTRPQIQLFNMIKEKYDPSASMEYVISVDGKCFQYDIFSPMKNQLIEMHGRAWHDVTSKNKRLWDIAKRNIQNDKRKLMCAKNLGALYVVFWDDQMATWPEKLKEFYEKA